MKHRKLFLVIFGLIPNILIGMLVGSFALIHAQALLHTGDVYSAGMLTYSVAYLLGSVALVRYVFRIATGRQMFGLTLGAVTTAIFVVAPSAMGYLELVSDFESPVENSFLVLGASVLSISPLVVFAIALSKSIGPNGNYKAQT